MARIFFSGFDANDLLVDGWNNSGGSNTLPSGWSYDGGGRTGSCLKLIAPSGTNSFVDNNVVASGTSGWRRVYIKVASLPATTRSIIGSAGLSNIALRSDGKLNYVTSGGTTLFTSTTALTDTSKWYLVEWLWSSSTTSQVRLRIDGVDEGTTATSQTSMLDRLGVSNLASAAFTIYFDDYAIDNAAFCGSGKVGLLVPVSDNSVGTGWQKPGGATTSLYTSVDNTPPVGVANSTSAGDAEAMIRNASDAAANYVANLTTYTNAGIGASDTINALQAIAIVGAPVSTGAKTGGLQLTSNPAEGSLTTFTNATAGQFWTGTAAGTYNTGWKIQRNAVVSSPSVTLGNNPQLTLDITGGTASRIAMCCFMGVYVDYTPPTVTTSTKTTTVSAVVSKADITKTVTATAVASKANITKTVTVSAIAAVTGTKTVTVSAVVQKTQTKSVTVTAVVQKFGVTKTTTVDTVVKKLDITKTVTVSAVTQKMFTATVTGSAVVQKTLTKSVTVSAVIQSSGTVTTTVTAVVQKTLTKSVTVDAVVQKTLTTTVTVNALVTDNSSPSLFVTVSAVVQKTATKTVTVSAVVTPQPKIVTVDAYLVMWRTTAKIVGMSAVVGGKQKFVTATAVVKKLAQTKTVTVSALVVKNFTKSVTASAVVKTTRTMNTAASAVIKKTTALAVTASAYLINLTPSLTVPKVVSVSAVVGSLDLTIEAALQEPDIEVTAVLQQP